MAHLIDVSNGRENMAYVGAKPWHGLGHELTPDAPIEVWCSEAGLNWEALVSPCYRPNQQGILVNIPSYAAIYRSDTNLTLGVVSDNYNVVQPREVVEFYRSLVEGMGFALETAGSLNQGKKVWALARTGEEADLFGDPLNGYVLLATSFDGTMATVADRTTIRVVCNNTLSLAVGTDGRRAAIRIPHSTTFVASDVKARLGLETSEDWDSFVDKAKELTKRKMKAEEAVEFFVNLLYPPNEDGEIEVDITHHAVTRRLQELEGIRTSAPGQQTKAANDTAWGIVNAVTYWTDHARTANSQDTRLDRAWFGDGKNLKARAFDQALKLVA